MQKINVLFIEDEDTTREAYASFLEDFSVEARSAEVAHKIFQQDPQKYDLLIVDISLPGKNGMEAIEEYRELRPDIPAIILTSHSDREFMVKYSQIGICGYLVKPVGETKLLTTIQLSLDNKLLCATDESTIDKPNSPLTYSDSSTKPLTRVAVIDPLKQQRSLVAGILELLGYPVFLYSGSKEAFTSIKKDQPEVVLINASYLEVVNPDSIRSFLEKHGLFTDTRIYGYLTDLKDQDSKLEFLIENRTILELLPSPFDYKQIDHLIRKSTIDDQS